MLKVGTEISQAAFDQLETTSRNPRLQVLASYNRNPLPLIGHEFNITNQDERYPSVVKLTFGGDLGYAAVWYSNSNIYFSRTDAAGITWQTPVSIVNLSGIPAFDCGIVELTNGRLGVTFIQISGANYQPKQLMLNSDGTVLMAVANLLSSATIAGLTNISNVIRISSNQDTRLNYYILFATVSGAMQKWEKNIGAGDWTNTAWTSSSISSDGLSSPPIVRVEPYICETTRSASPTYEIDLAYTAYSTTTGARDVYLRRSNDSANSNFSAAFRINPTPSDISHTGTSGTNILYESPAIIQRGSLNGENYDKLYAMYLRHTKNIYVNLAFYSSLTGQYINGSPQGNGYNWVWADSILRRLWVANTLMPQASLQVFDMDNPEVGPKYNDTAIFQNDIALHSYTFGMGVKKFCGVSEDYFVSGSRVFSPVLGTIAFCRFNFKLANDTPSAWTSFQATPPGSGDLNSPYASIPYIDGLPMGTLLFMQLIGTRCYCLIGNETDASVTFFGYWDISSNAPSWVALLSPLDWNLNGMPVPNQVVYSLPGAGSVSSTNVQVAGYGYIGGMRYTPVGSVYMDVDTKEVLFCCSSRPGNADGTELGSNAQGLGSIVVCSYDDDNPGLRRVYATGNNTNTPGGYTAYPNCVADMALTVIPTNDAYSRSIIAQSNEVGIYLIQGFPRNGAIACCRAGTPSKLYIIPDIRNVPDGVTDQDSLKASLMVVDEGLAWPNGLTCTNVSNLNITNSVSLNQPDWHANYSPPQGLQRLEDGRVCVNYLNHGVRILDPNTGMVKALDANARGSIFSSSIIHGNLANTGSGSNPSVDPTNDSMPILCATVDTLTKEMILAQNYYAAAFFSQGNPNGGYVIVDDDGDFYEPIYSLVGGLQNTYTTSPSFSAEVPFTASYQDRDFGLTTNGSTSLAAMWSKQNTNSQKRFLNFEVEQPYPTDPTPGIDITKYISGDVIVEATLDNKPGTASFNATPGNLFASSNIRSIYSTLLGIGNKVVVKRGEAFARNSLIVPAFSSRTAATDGSSHYIWNNLNDSGIIGNYNIPNNLYPDSRCQYDFDLTAYKAAIPGGVNVTAVSITYYINGINRPFVGGNIYDIFKALNPIAQYHSPTDLFNGVLNGSYVAQDGVSVPGFKTSVLDGTVVTAVNNKLHGSDTNPIFSAGFLQLNEGNPAYGYEVLAGASATDKSLIPVLNITFSDVANLVEYTTIFTGTPDKSVQSMVRGEMSTRRVTCYDMRKLMTDIQIDAAGTTQSTAKYALVNLAQEYLNVQVSQTNIPEDMDGKSSTDNYSFHGTTLLDVFAQLCQRFQYSLDMDRNNIIRPRRMIIKKDLSLNYTPDYIFGLDVVSNPNHTNQLTGQPLLLHSYNEVNNTQDTTNKIIVTGVDLVQSIENLPTSQIATGSVHVGTGLTYVDGRLVASNLNGDWLRFDPLTATLRFPPVPNVEGPMVSSCINALTATNTYDRLIALRDQHNQSSENLIEKFTWYKYNAAASLKLIKAPLAPGNSVLNGQTTAGQQYLDGQGCEYYFGIVWGRQDIFSVLPEGDFDYTITGNERVAIPRRFYAIWQDGAKRAALGGAEIKQQFYVPNIHDQKASQDYADWKGKLVRWNNDSVELETANHPALEVGDTIQIQNPFSKTNEVLFVYGIIRTMSQESNIEAGRTQRSGVDKMLLKCFRDGYAV